MQSDYRAFWNNKMWEVFQIDYREPKCLGLTDGTTDYLNVPFEDVVLMRSTGKKDISGEMVYEGDFIESHQGICVLDILMFVKYGAYEAYCPVDKCYMNNVGFYVESVDHPQMPVGPLEEYAKVIGNKFLNFDWLSICEVTVKEDDYEK